MAERLTIQFDAKGGGALKKTIEDLHLANVKLTKGQAAFVRAQKQATKEMEKNAAAGAFTTKTNRNLGGTFSVLRSKVLLAAFAITSMTHTFRRFTQASAEVTEGLNKANVVFGESIGVVQEWADALGGAIGRSSDKIVMMASIFQDTLVPMGATRDSAAALSTQMTKLALDVASFNNKADADVIKDFQSAMVGNHETVRKYGINITQATLKQQAFEMSLFSGKGELSEQAKIQARVALLFKGTSDAQGDLMRTQKDYTNLVKKLNDQLFDSYKKIGDILTKFILPPIIKLATLLAQPKHILAFAAALAAMATKMFFASKVGVSLVAGLKAMKTQLFAVATGAHTAKSAMLALNAATLRFQKNLGRSTLGLSLLAAAVVELGFWLFSSEEEVEDFDEELKKLEEELAETALQFDDVSESVEETDDSLQKLNESIEESINNLKTDILLLKKDNPLLKEALQITNARQGGLSNLTETELKLLAIKQEQTLLNETLNEQESEGLELLNEKNKSKIEELKNSEEFIKARTRMIIKEGEFSIKQKEIFDNFIEEATFGDRFGGVFIKDFGVDEETATNIASFFNNAQESFEAIIEGYEEVFEDADLDIDTLLTMPLDEAIDKLKEFQVEVDDAFVEAGFTNLNIDWLQQLPTVIEFLEKLSDGSKEQEISLNQAKVAVEELNQELHVLKVNLITSQVEMDSLLQVSDSLKSAFKFLSFDLTLLAETFTETFEILREEGFTAAEAYQVAWIQAAGTVTSALIESQLSITENQISEARKRARSELEHLRETRKYQKASDKQKKKLEEEATKASVDEMKKAFKRKQDLARTGVIIDTASAIMAIWKDVPKVDFGAAAWSLVGLVSALGASQLELINSQQPPKMARGGYIGGRRHSEGGTLIEAEQGEFIMNRDAVSTLGIETMNRINRGQGGSLVNVSFNGNVMSDDFIQEEAIPKIKEAIRRGADIGIG